MLISFRKTALRKGDCRQRTGLGLIFFSLCSALLLDTTYVIFFRKKNERDWTWEHIMDSGFYRWNNIPPTFLSHVKYTGIDPTLRRHYESFRSFHYVFLYQTKQFPTYPAHLHSTGSTRKATPWSTACSLPLPDLLAGSGPLLVMLCFSSLTPPLLPVFSLLWDSQTMNPQYSNVHWINGVLSKTLWRNPHSQCDYH